MDCVRYVTHGGGGNEREWGGGGVMGEVVN